MRGELTMVPGPGTRQVRHVGDRIEVWLKDEAWSQAKGKGRAFLRTTIGSGAILNDEIVRSFEDSRPLSHAAWHDLPMEPCEEGFRLTLWLPETGFFRGKPFWVDEGGRQHWPSGDDFGISVHPDRYRTGNTIYCAWPRLFGASKTESELLDPEREEALAKWDREGYSVIPPSGTFRDLARELDHIVDRLGCRVLHLLPVNPTPTTFARFGRYGSPYASLDLTAIDPALVVFDQRTTGIEQFAELTSAVHRKGAVIFIDLVINHTGWGSRLQETYPEWFRRGEDGRFASPGAWGTTWEDLVELEHHDPKLGEGLADVFLTWCRRGVDGFRCDAGYMVPLPVWRYITARVRREFPNTIFLLEGLGGAWEVTEQLLTEGGMQWAYSELFQNVSGEEVAGYTDYALPQSQRVGLYVHYSETHDNPRLAARGESWSRLRNRLCALSSVNGGYGFTCGVEWLAAEKIVVHQRTGLRWGQEPNLVEELARLNDLLSEHPCFFDGAKLRRMSPPDSPVFALERVSGTGEDRVVVLVNTRIDRPESITIPEEEWKIAGGLGIELLQPQGPEIERRGPGGIQLRLAPGAAHCLAGSPVPRGEEGRAYRQRMAIQAWVISALWRSGCPVLVEQDLMNALVDQVIEHPLIFLSLVAGDGSSSTKQQAIKAFAGGSLRVSYSKTVLWEPGSERGIVPVPAEHWLVVRDDRPFEIHFGNPERTKETHWRSTRIRDDLHLVGVGAESLWGGTVELTMFRGEAGDVALEGRLERLPAHPNLACDTAGGSEGVGLEAPIVLLTNRRGGMARLARNLGRVKSKYDCLLGANLHPDLPVDRHVLAKRIRVWVNAGGLITALERDNLVAMQPGPPARWRYLICAGQGRWIPLELTVDLVEDQNTLILRCLRSEAGSIPNAEVERLYGPGNAVRARRVSSEAVDALSVSITVRVDIEDRSFHGETQRSGEADQHFREHVVRLNDGIGFEFQPENDRRLRVRSNLGRYHDEGEWSENISHPVEASRGQYGAGDAYSPGWFEVSLDCGKPALYEISAEAEPTPWSEAESWFKIRSERISDCIHRAELDKNDCFGARLVTAASAFVVRRNRGFSVIAGYPWFLDWGRDSLICARGLLACGYQDEIVGLLKEYGRLEREGTLPNSIHGEDTSNRDTSDAPLWYGMVCSDLVERLGIGFLQTPLGGSKSRGGSRTIGSVLQGIASGYLRGTPNGIAVDRPSGLVWSPSHFTWMDTNYPAGTPRQGYPVEIQVMWIQLLRLLDRAGLEAGGEDWSGLAAQAAQSFEDRFWLDTEGYCADLIIAEPGQRAEEGIVDSALRSNFPMAVSTGLVSGDRARRAVQIALHHLMVPGAVRSLAPRSVAVPLPVHGNDGQVLNDPKFPYWGRYEGEEETRRKPAYHNGTAWIWPLGILCEAVLEAWEESPEAVMAVRSYLSGVEGLLNQGCVGHLPEILDGDAPHTQRGCDAQAWSVTEVLRIWKRVSSIDGSSS